MNKRKSVAILLTALFSIVLLGQNTNPFGSITGIVRDPSGASIPGVTVTAVGPGGITTVTTNEQGIYTLEKLAAGSYTVSASLRGFTTSTMPGIQVTPGNQARQSFALQVQGVQGPYGLKPYQENPGPEIRADRQTRRGTVIEYRGNVRMTTRDLEVRGDELDYDTVSGTGDMRGNVTFRTLPATVRAIPLSIH